MGRTAIDDDELTKEILAEIEVERKERNRLPRPVRPSKKRIAKAQDCLLDWLGIAHGRALSVCWACLAEDPGTLERAHIIATWKGGDGHPANFFLLCAFCHNEQPDWPSVRLQLLWCRYHERQLGRIARQTENWRRAITDGLGTDEEIADLFREIQKEE